MGRTGSGVAVEVGLDEGEVGAVGILVGWEMVGGVAVGLGIGLERGEGIVGKGEMGVEDGGGT